MKLITSIIVLSVLFSLNAFSQHIKEDEGVYMAGSKPYTGLYKTNFDNGKVKTEMSLVDGLKEGDVKVYFENGVLNEIRSYHKNIMHGTWISYNEKSIKI